MQLEGSHIAWHPDGRCLGAMVSRHGLKEIEVVDVTAGDVRRLRGGLRRLRGGLRHVLDMHVSLDRLIFVAVSMRRP